ncbi:MAG: helix-turn-helix domain-containing protein [Betaproteobacteria bacterium]|nr:helix-turn-helix domain-containing protein [Betaproteobacteria bacterium]
MTGTQQLIDALKRELKAAGITYAVLAARIGMSESSVKRMFSKRDMPLSRIDEICAACRLRFDDLARQVAEAAPQLHELSAEQERAVVADRKLLLVAICALSQWSFAQITERYRLSDAECVRCLTRLDKLGIIELKPLNRYRLKVAKTFRWRPGGPVQRYFREHVIGDYFSGHFDGEGEVLLLVHGSIHRAMLANFAERIQRLGQDFSAQHVADQKLAPALREGVTLVLAMREWEFEAFRDLHRN